VGGMGPTPRPSQDVDRTVSLDQSTVKGYVTP
jgi:hypothetical protein